VVKDLTIRVKLGKPSGGDLVRRSGRHQHGTPGAGPAKYQGKLLPGGGFRLRVGQLVLNFSSLFSYPTPDSTP